MGIAPRWVGIPTPLCACARRKFGSGMSVGRGARDVTRSVPSEGAVGEGSASQGVRNGLPGGTAAGEMSQGWPRSSEGATASDEVSSIRG